MSEIPETNALQLPPQPEKERIATPATTATTTQTRRGRRSQARARFQLGRTFSKGAIAGLASVVGLASIAIATQQYLRQEVKRSGTETRAVVHLDAPYGSLAVIAGTNSGILAVVEHEGDEDEETPIRVRYGLNSTRNTGNLRISIGADEGYLEQPLTAWHASSARSPFVTANYLQTDFGAAYHYGEEAEEYVAAPSPAPSNSAITRLYLSREVPLLIDAQLGFGDSKLDLTGVPIEKLLLETGASKAQMGISQPNPAAMSECRVSAGLGECKLWGLANLNTAKFEFSGGLGYYDLGFNGKLSRNMEAVVSVGLGKVSINIPPDAGRVQVIYDDGLFSSFQFSGLTKKRDGYATSVGFENSNAPILTLRLSTGMGKMVVSYRK